MIWIASYYVKMLLKIMKNIHFCFKVIIQFPLHSIFNPMQLLCRRILFNSQWNEFLDEGEKPYYPLEGSPEIKYYKDAILQYIRKCVQTHYILPHCQKYINVFSKFKSSFSKSKHFSFIK